MKTASLRNRGWPVIGSCIAIVRVPGGFAVGVQERLRSGGTGLVYRTMRRARRAGAALSTRHNLPVIESV